MCTKRPLHIPSSHFFDTLSEFGTERTNDLLYFYSTSDKLDQHDHKSTYARCPRSIAAAALQAQTHNRHEPPCWDLTSTLSTCAKCESFVLALKTWPSGSGESIRPWAQKTQTPTLIDSSLDVYVDRKIRVATKVRRCEQRPWFDQRKPASLIMISSFPVLSALKCTST